MAVHNPVGDNYQKALTNSSTQVADPIPQQTDTLRVVNHSGNGIHVAIGNTPTASSSNYFMDKHTEAFLSLGPVLSQRVVSITKGTTTVITFPEGVVGCPFAVNDTVAVTVSSKSGWDIPGNAKVTAVTFADPRAEDSRTTCTLNYNSSAFSGTFTDDDQGQGDKAVARKAFRVAGICSTGTGQLNVQQVQITGDA